MFYEIDSGLINLQKCINISKVRAGTVSDNYLISFTTSEDVYIKTFADSDAANAEYVRLTALLTAWQSDITA